MRAVLIWQPSCSNQELPGILTAFSFLPPPYQLANNHMMSLCHCNHFRGSIRFTNDNALSQPLKNNANVMSEWPIIIHNNHL
jgi:hypothetical protein